MTHNGVRLWLGRLPWLSCSMSACWVSREAVFAQDVGWLRGDWSLEHRSRDGVAWVCFDVGMSDLDLGALYGLVRERLSGLVADLPEPSGVAVPACPGWSVQDVVAHVVAIAGDVVSGRLDRPPTDEWTAAQVAAAKGKSMADLLAEWGEVGPRFQDLINRARMWPGFLDALSHEHDVRGALGVPAGRHGPDMVAAAEFLVAGLRPDRAMSVLVGEREFLVGPSGEPVLRLVTEPFEAFRFRMGRRSLRQIVAMDWDGDPAPVLDRLCIFGPAVADVVE